MLNCWILLCTYFSAGEIQSGIWSSCRKDNQLKYITIIAQLTALLVFSLFIWLSVCLSLCLCLSAVPFSALTLPQKLMKYGLAFVPSCRKDNQLKYKTITAQLTAFLVISQFMCLSAPLFMSLCCTFLCTYVAKESDEIVPGIWIILSKGQQNALIQSNTSTTTRHHYGTISITVYIALLYATLCYVLQQYFNNSAGFTEWHLRIENAFLIPHTFLVVKRIWFLYTRAVAYSLEH